MNILITGGFGFVGARLAVELSSKGFNVILGTRSLSEKFNKLPGFDFLKIDWEGDLEVACKDIDIIIHAAGTSAKDSGNDPTSALHFNGVITSKLIHAAYMSGVGKFFYISTAHVYQAPLFGNIDEMSQTVNNHPYAYSHRAGEYSLLFALEKGLIDGAVIRLSNSFGVPLVSNTGCWKLLVNDLCRQAIESNTLELKGDGSDERDFVSLRDVTNVISQLLVLPELKAKIINLGSGQSKSTKDIALLVQRHCKEMFGKVPKVIFNKADKKNEKLKLNYILNTLDFYGIKSNLNFDSEIVDLLNYCRRAFGD